MMSASRRILGDARPPPRRRIFGKRVVQIDPSLRDGSLRSMNRLFRNFYHVRASHCGKPRSYWRKPAKSKVARLLALAGLGLAKSFSKDGYE